MDKKNTKTDARVIYNPNSFEREYHMNQGHKDFLKRLLVNDNNRTPLTKDDKYNINKCLLQGFYMDKERNLLIELRTKYKDHVWGTKI